MKHFRYKVTRMAQKSVGLNWVGTHTATSQYGINNTARCEVRRNRTLDVEGPRELYSSTIVVLTS